MKTRAWIKNKMLMLCFVGLVLEALIQLMEYSCDYLQPETNS